MKSGIEKYQMASLRTTYKLLVAMVALKTMFECLSTSIFVFIWRSSMNEKPKFNNKIPSEKKLQMKSINLVAMMQP